MIYRILPQEILDLAVGGLLEDIPDDHNHYLERMEISIGLGEYDQAAAWADSLLRFAQTNPSTYTAWRDKGWVIGEIGIAHAVKGNHQLALQCGNEALHIAEPYNNAFWTPEFEINLAEIYVLLGEHEEAIDLLDEILGKPAMISVAVLKIDPLWDPLRDNPRFQELLRKYR